MKVFNREIKLGGAKKSSTLRVLMVDGQEKVLFCTGTAVPTGAGFAKGCFFIKTDASTNGTYQNEGSTTSASFQLVTAADIADDAVTTAKILNANVTAAKLASDAVETVKIKNANVTLAKLAAGITPSHVVKFFKLGSTITTTALVGLAVNDLIVSILGDGTVAVALCAQADTLPADPADTTYLIVFRAAA